MGKIMHMGKSYTGGLESATLDQLSNVQISNPSDYQVLTYKNAKWVNESIPAIDLTITPSKDSSSITVTTPSGETITPTQALSGVWECTVHAYGTYTIHEIEGTSDSTKQVTVDTVMQYYVQMRPDGSTVLPTDDVPTWLACGGITDKNYTTLSEVYADADTLSSLITDNNAMDYLVRSKSWITSAGLVPQLSSNTGSNGVVNECGQTFNSTYPSWKAFDGNSSSYTALNSASNIAYIGYTFNNPRKIALIECDMRGLGTISYTIKLSAEYSDDGTTWNNASDEYSITGSISSTTKITVTETSPHRYWRVKRNSPTENISTVCYELQFYSIINNVGLVPKMTSNTTPSGVASADSEYSSSYAAYKSFDGDTSTYWSPSNGTTTKWLQYMFTNAIRLVKWSCIWDTFSLADIKNAVSSITLQGSNDGFVSDINNIDTVNTADMTVNSLIRTVSVNTDYTYFRISFAKKANNNTPPSRVQFYSYDDKGITEESTAMSLIGLNNYASNTLLLDVDWNEAIQNSTYFESVDNAKVPTMTSDNTPSGECIASVSGSAGIEYHCFDNDLSTLWGTPQYTRTGDIGYIFPESVRVLMFKIIKDYYTSGTSTANIQYSDDGTNWDNAFSSDFIINHSSSEKMYIVPYGNPHRYWRLRETTTNDSVAYNELQFYGRVDI